MLWTHWQIMTRTRHSIDDYGSRLVVVFWSCAPAFIVVNVIVMFTCMWTTTIIQYIKKSDLNRGVSDSPWCTDVHAHKRTHTYTRTRMHTHICTHTYAHKHTLVSLIFTWTATVVNTFSRLKPQTSENVAKCPHKGTKQVHTRIHTRAF